MQELFNNFGIYIHIPFCDKKCSYCHFYKKTPNKEDLDFYIEALEQELALYDFKKPETMFWGGGTPSSLSHEHIQKLYNILKNHLPTKEWTVEVAPTSLTKSKLELLKDIGVSRISMGVQSFSEKTLHNLGRKHTLYDTLKAIEYISEVDFQHFNIDLIFASPKQSLDDFYADLVKASQQPVDHISAYCLEFENATSNCAGNDTNYNVARDAEADFLNIAFENLPLLGFNQYEISNYAKDGAQCLHNLSTWNMAQWIGLGPSAASQFDMVRRKNPNNITKWANAVIAKNPIYEDFFEIDSAELLNSSVIFGLRLNEGINTKKLKKRFSKLDFSFYDEKFKELQNEGLLTINEDFVKLSRKGMLLADSVQVELLV